MDRRAIVKGLAVGAGVCVLPTSAVFARSPIGLPIHELRPIVDAGEANLVLSHEDQEAYAPFNTRTAKVPCVRILPKTDRAVIGIVEWLRRNSISFSVSGGGHSFEGLSQSTTAILDLSVMRTVVVDTNRNTVQAAGGAKLGDIYQIIGQAGYGIPGGSCETVGVAGLTLGGGYGLFSRAWGMTCDQLISMELVLADGRKVLANSQTNPDLYWACRGGGGCTFGVVTNLTYKLHPAETLRTISVDWEVSQATAVKVLRAWQDWAPIAPKEITCLIRVERLGNGTIALRCRGHTLGTGAQANRELLNLTRIHSPVSSPKVCPRAFPGFVARGATRTTMKGKSDFVLHPMSEAGFQALLSGVLNFSPGTMTAILDPYGGAISDLSDSATAFAHRTNTLFSIQYYSGESMFEPSSQTRERLRAMKSVYQSMRPHVGMGAFVNYCDLDLPNWEVRYWGDNLSRLKSVKASYDPEDLFQTMQSVSL